MTKQVKALSAPAHLAASYDYFLQDIQDLTPFWYIAKMYPVFFLAKHLKKISPS